MSRPRAPRERFLGEFRGVLPPNRPALRNPFQTSRSQVQLEEDVDDVTGACERDRVDTGDPGSKGVAELAESRSTARGRCDSMSGSPPDGILLGIADLDNHLYPLAAQLEDPGLVSARSTKQHSQHSFVGIGAVHDVLVAKTATSAKTVADKEQTHDPLYAGTSAAPRFPFQTRADLSVAENLRSRRHMYFH
jgi:hypothetical protein